MENREHGALFMLYRDKGDLSAFQILVDFYNKPLFNYLLRLLRRMEDAEDALQEVWFKVIRQAHTYNDQGRFSSWIYRVAHNHCMDLFRRKSRFPIEEENHDPEHAESWLDRLETEDPSPRDLLMEQERFDMLEAAVGQLPEAIREVYILRAMNDVPFKEIAEIQNAPLGTVLSRMHQAVQRLKQAVAEEEKASLGTA